MKTDCGTGNKRAVVNTAPARSKTIFRIYIIFIFKLMYVHVVLRGVKKAVALLFFTDKLCMSCLILRDYWLVAKQKSVETWSVPII